MAHTPVAPFLPAEAAALCDRCLGRRLVGAIGEPQPEVGAAARAERGWDPVAAADCPVCEDSFTQFDDWLRVALEELQHYEFSTFQIGTAFPEPCEAIEKGLLKAVGEEGPQDTIRTEANRLLGPAIAEATGATLETGGRPELALLVDTRFWTAEATPNSVYVRGRYTKTRRDIPQTHWPCRRCQGRGCWECNDTGVQYAESVEDAIAAVLVPAFDAKSASFHGAGREDIDALMLGTGRPFILELNGPRKRTADLAAAEAAINATSAESGVGVTGLRPAEKAEVAAIKAGEYQKEYLAHCVSEAPVSRAAVEAACAALTGTTLEQRTPERVSHRRADLVRNRTVEHVTIESWPPGQDSSDRFSVRVLAESGTYIKEMVHGDEGRTTPNMAALVGVPTRVEFLDVVAILDDRPSTGGGAAGN